MNPIVVGPNQWELFEELPWLFSTEVLTLDDVRSFIKYVYFAIVCFMCKACAIDAQEQLKKFSLDNKKALYKLFSADGNGKIFTRTSLARGSHLLHGQVNEKLGKFKGYSFESYLKPKSRQEIFETMKRQTELFIGYFPDENTKWEMNETTGLKMNEHYSYDEKTVNFYFKYFFSQVIPDIFLLIDSTLKKSEMEATVWVNKLNMFRWLNLFLSSSKFLSKIDWTIKTKNLYFTSISPKQKCGNTESKKGTIFQGCQ